MCHNCPVLCTLSEALARPLVFVLFKSPTKKVVSLGFSTHQGRVLAHSVYHLLTNHFSDYIAKKEAFLLTSTREKILDIGLSIYDGAQDFWF